MIQALKFSIDHFIKELLIDQKKLLACRNNHAGIRVQVMHIIIVFFHIGRGTDECPTAMRHLEVTCGKESISPALVNLDPDLVLLKSELLQVRVILQIHVRLLIHSCLMIRLLVCIPFNESLYFYVSLHYRII